jgi:hypothetical protein
MRQFVLPYEHFRALAAAFLPPSSADWWLNRFADIERRKRLFRFNLAAAFWSFFWFWYHKMYLLGLVFMAAFMGVDLLAEALLAPFCLPWGLDGVVRFFAPMVVSALTIGFLADALYWYHCRRRIEALWLRFGMTVPDVAFAEFLARKGGVNLRGPLLAVGGLLGALGLVFGVLFWQSPDVARDVWRQQWQPQQKAACDRPPVLDEVSP